MNLSIVDYFGYNLSSQERLRLIKEAGFGSFCFYGRTTLIKIIIYFPNTRETSDCI